MRSRRALLTAAGVVSLVLLQLYTAHRYTTSARAVATGVGGRLNGLWARYKERNFTMPRFLSGPHVVSKGMFNVSASQWLFSARPKSGGSVPHLTLPAVNRTAERERNERDRTEMLQALERQVKDGIKLSARAAPLFQKSSRVSPAPARQGARAGGGAPSNASSTMGDPVAGARNSSLAASGAIGEAVPDVSNRTRGAVGPSVGRRGAGRRGKGEGGSKGKPGKVLLFTMDSLLKTIEEAKHGGPAGEITVRTSLEAGLLELGFSLDVAGSDDHFAQLSAAALSALRRSGTHYYRFIIMDPWTWAEKAPPSAHTAVRARPLLEGRENATFILDFFGNKKLAIRDAELKIPKAHVLTAFPSPYGESFLGFYFSAETTQYVDAMTYNLTKHHVRLFDPNAAAQPLPHSAYHLHREVDHRENQGVLWGKKRDYFVSSTGHGILAQAARFCRLVSLLPSSAGKGELGMRNVRHIGHQSKAQFRALLADSKFLLGLGDPLSGPSALEAMLAGAMYIQPTFAFEGGNPRYPAELRQHFTSQHPYMAEHIGAPYVCNFAMLSPALPNATELRGCIHLALNSTLRPRVPDHFTHEAYSGRVRAIFKAFL